MVAVSFTAVSYGRMAAAFPEAGSTYAYASKAIHPVVGYLAGWVMILDYILMPMLCVIIIGVTSNKLLPAVPYSVWVIFAACAITAINLSGIEMTMRATIVFTIILSVSVVWFFAAAIRALLHGVGLGTLISLKPFYNPATFSLKAVMAATPVAVLSFLGFDGISTLAEDAKNPQKDIGRATVLVCFIAGGLFILQTYCGQLLWPDYSTFSPIETAFSDIGRLIGGPGLFYLIAFLVVAQAWASGITSQASASRLLFGMARDGKLPHLVFGYVHPQRRTPIYSMLLMGGIALGGGAPAESRQSRRARELWRLRGLHGGEPLRDRTLLFPSATARRAMLVGQPCLTRRRLSNLRVDLVECFTACHESRLGVDDFGPRLPVSPHPRLSKTAGECRERGVILNHRNVFPGD